MAGRTIPGAQLLGIIRNAIFIVIILYGRLDRLEPLGPAFVRSHKSYLVNLDHVLAIDDELSIFRMRGGGTAYIRKGAIPAMRRRYDDRLIERVRLS